MLFQIIAIPLLRLVLGRHVKSWAVGNCLPAAATNGGV